jgi:hypothetical protein
MSRTYTPELREEALAVIAKVRNPHAAQRYRELSDPANPQTSYRYLKVVFEAAGMTDIEIPRPERSAVGMMPTGTIQPHGDTRGVAVVVISHNYGHWLGECLDSVLAQTTKAADVLVIDDSSTDDTKAVVASYAPQGVRYRRIDAGHVWESRKAGYEATRADVLCFLDADDRLPPDYLESSLRLLADRKVGIVYSDVEWFGDLTGRSNYPEFDARRTDRENYMHAASLVRRAALDVSQAFRSPRPGMSHADWYLWRQVIDAGFTAAKSPAVYQYRRHGGSMIHGAMVRQADYYELANLSHAPVTIVCPLSGREWAWPRYRDWLDAQMWTKDQCRVLILDSGPTPGAREWALACDYPDVRYQRLDVGDKGLAEKPRANHASDVRKAMSRIYNRMARAIETPFAFVLEDDVIPPCDVIDRLMKSMDRNVIAVSGAYPSRYAAGYVAWLNPGQHLSLGSGVQEIGGCGFGCLLLRRDVIETEHFANVTDEHPDYDVNFFQRHRGKGKVRIDWSVQAEHLHAPGWKPETRVAVNGTNPYRDNLLKIAACDYRGPRVGCGCNGLSLCYAGHGKAAHATIRPELVEHESTEVIWDGKSVAFASTVTNSDCRECLGIKG